MSYPLGLANSQDDCPHCKLPTVCKNCGRRRKLPPGAHETTSLCVYSTGSQCDSQDHAVSAVDADISSIGVVSPENLRTIFKDLETSRTSLEKWRLEAETLREENNRIFDRCRLLKEELMTKERLLAEKDGILDSARLEFQAELDSQESRLLNSHRVSIDNLCHRFSGVLSRERLQQLARRWRMLTKMQRKARSRSRASYMIATWISGTVRFAWRTLLMFKPKRRGYEICQLSMSSIDPLKRADCSSQTLTSLTLVSCDILMIKPVHVGTEVSTCTNSPFSLVEVFHPVCEILVSPGSALGTMTSEEWPSGDAQRLVRRQLTLIRYMNRRIRFLERKRRRNFLIRTLFF
jgi:hypothetical protein